MQQVKKRQNVLENFEYLNKEFKKMFNITGSCK